MAIYTYKGIDKTGKELKANINSESINMAKQKLRAQGIMLLEIKENKTDKAGQQKGSISFGASVNIEDLSLMTRQLATLVRAKIQIVDALAALMDQTENAKLRLILSEVRQKVNEGISLAKAFSDYPKVFNNVYVNMVEAGEQSGNLEIVLLRLADFTQAQTQLKNKIKGAVTYPVIMALVGMIMFGIIFTVVIPKITKIFVSMKKDIPLPTQICIWISYVIQNYWYLIIGGAIGAFLIFYKWIHTPKGEAKWHAFLLKVPIIGPLVMMINVSRFCSTLGTLLNSGVPILTSLKIVKNLIANVHMQRAVEEARTFVQEGASMAVPLKNSGLFPPMVIHMITLGEKAGEMEDMLKIVSENYEDQVNTKLTGLTSVIEPIMMVVMGGLVGFVVFAVVVPMMELNSVN